MKKEKMIKFSLLVLMSFFLVIGNVNAKFQGVKGNKNVVTQERNVGSFSGIKLTCSADVFISQGKSESVTVKADENLVDLIKTEVIDDVLIIKIGKSIWNAKVLEVYVTVKNLDKILNSGSGDISSETRINGMDMYIRMSGSGDLDAEFDVKNLEIKMSGSGDTEISGVRGNLKLSVSGSGDFEAEELQLEECNIKLTGSGDIELKGSAVNLTINQSSSGDINAYGLSAGVVDIKGYGSGDMVVNVTDKLKVHLNGSGDVTYRGNPDIVDVESNGSGEVYSR